MAASADATSCGSRGRVLVERPGFGERRHRRGGVDLDQPREVRAPHREVERDGGRSVAQRLIGGVAAGVGGTASLRRPGRRIRRRGSPGRLDS